MDNRYDIFKSKIKWQVYNKNLKQLNVFEYSCFRFTFKINNQELMEAFTELICKDEIPMPWVICDWLLKNNVKFKIGFRYNNKVSFKVNYVLFKTVVWLKYRLMKVYVNNIKFSIEKPKEIRNGLIFHLYNLNIDTSYAFQIDTEINWKPRVFKDENDKYKFNSYAWLFGCFAKTIKKSKIEEEK